LCSAWLVDGGGAEMAITRNLVGRVEYLYDDFGHKNYIGSTGDPYRVSFRGQTVRGALAWNLIRSACDLSRAHSLNPDPRRIETVT
jgi:hypothetical protein